MIQFQAIKFKYKSKMIKVKIKIMMRIINMMMNNNKYQVKVIRIFNFKVKKIIVISS